MKLPAILAEARPLADGFTTVIPEHWHQGRTAFGGFSAALALSAALRVGGELPPLRSAQVSFVGPLAGEVSVNARVLRRGRNASWVSAEIKGEGGIGLTATFVFMGPVESTLHLNDCPPPAELIDLNDAQPFAFHEHTPAFLRNHFEVRFAMPKSAGKLPELCWWIRPTECEQLDPMIALLLTADALPPGVLPLLNPRVRVSSMTWQCNLLTPTPTTRDGWWLLRSSGDYAELGCSSQRMQIWNADGEPVMAGMQSIALFD
jgi:acyl-CoA thioesterase